MRPAWAREKRPNYPGFDAIPNCDTSNSTSIVAAKRRWANQSANLAMVDLPDHQRGFANIRPVRFPESSLPGLRSGQVPAHPEAETPGCFACNRKERSTGNFGAKPDHDGRGWAAVVPSLR